MPVEFNNVTLYVMEIMGGKLTVFGTNDKTTLSNLVGLNGMVLIPPKCMLKILPILITGPTLIIPCIEDRNYSSSHQ
jgi:hypothetical protein